VDERRRLPRMTKIRTIFSIPFQCQWYREEVLEAVPTKDFLEHASSSEQEAHVSAADFVSEHPDYSVSLGASYYHIRSPREMTSRSMVDGADD
jgi:hypothetical protein